jgi:dTMP kinase
MNPGKFITLEGGEGVGKTTNLGFIHDYLQQQQVEHILTREPGGCELSEKIRHLLLDKSSEAISDQAELLLIFAARAQHIKTTIEPALAAGQWVICDRFTDASYAYQGGGRGIDITAISWLESWVQDTLRPDLTLLFDAPTEIGMRRAKNRSPLDRFEMEETDFFDRVRQAYLRQAEAHPDRIRLVNADLPLNNVQQQIVSALKTLLP